MIAFWHHLEAVMRKLVRSRILSQYFLGQQDFLMYGWSRRYFSQCDCCKCLRQFARDGAIQIRQNDNGNPIFGVVGHVRVKATILCRRTVPLPTGANLRLTNKESLTRSRSWYRSCDPH